MSFSHFVFSPGDRMSDHFLLTIFLALSGGFQDAYTYAVRDRVFANAQTGNIVLMSTALLSGQWRAALRYLFPLLSFAAGILIAEQFEARFKYAKRIHWRQGILFAEILLLFAVGFLPASMNLPANMTVSLSCAMQVQSFRKVNGIPYASTMCIGNLRGGTAALSAFLRTRDRRSLIRAQHYFAIILLFGLGAGIGGRLSPLLGPRAIWGSALLLLAGNALMFQRDAGRTS